MKRVAIHAPGDIRVEDVPEPVPGPGESLVRILSVGLCGSDLHWYEDGAIGDAVLTEPLVLGHEMSGEVVAGPLAGRTVVLDPAVPCGDCRECDAGMGHLCERMRFAGHGHTDGALQELMAWPDHRIRPIPDGRDSAELALLEPLGVAVHSVDLGHLRHGRRVAVIGAGPIGLMIVQLAALGGCDVTVVEPLAHRRDAARGAGATSVFDRDDDGGELAGSCDVAFEVSGTDDGLAHAVRLVRPGTRIVIVGIPGDDSTSFRAASVRRKGLTLAFARRMTDDAYARAIALGTNGTIDLSWLTTHRFGLDHADEAFAAAAGRVGLKVAVDVRS